MPNSQHEEKQELIQNLTCDDEHITATKSLPAVILESISYFINTESDCSTYTGSTHQKGRVQSMLSNREMLHEKEFGINHINKCPNMYIYHTHTHIHTKCSKILKDTGLKGAVICKIKIVHLHSKQRTP